MELIADSNGGLWTVLFVILIICLIVWIVGRWRS